jgi:hypothetical protein
MGNIIRLTKLVFKDNIVVSEKSVLFNTTELISAEEDQYGTRIKYKEAIVNGFSCRESLEDIERLIKE